MSLPKISEVRKLTISEISQEIISSKRALFDLNFKKATKQPFKSHLFKHTRHRLAQLLTIESEKKSLS
uniref:ribosomal protein L29 n=1 Tax=Goniotrichopsis reniformis TaxID=468933 RepID=UPI001FCDFBF9|nr:ribosomal protein L29 [Goniotrichopsis reniformis]UNJ14768.1 ribosomal protein L29 [Goniotrichopsis reniformis]